MRCGELACDSNLSGKLDLEDLDADDGAARIHFIRAISFDFGGPATRDCPPAIDGVTQL